MLYTPDLLRPAPKPPDKAPEAPLTQEVTLSDLRSAALLAFEDRHAKAFLERSIDPLPLKDVIPVPEAIAQAIEAGAEVDTRRYEYDVQGALLTLNEGNILAVLKSMPEVLGAHLDPTKVTVHGAKKPDYIWRVTVNCIGAESPKQASIEGLHARMDSAVERVSANRPRPR